MPLTITLTETDGRITVSLTGQGSDEVMRLAFAALKTIRKMLADVDKPVFVAE